MTKTRSPLKKRTAGGKNSDHRKGVKGTYRKLGRATKRTEESFLTFHVKEARPGTISKGERFTVGKVREKMGLSQIELARMTGFSLRSIAGWESGKVLSDAAKQKVTETDRLRQALSQLIPAPKLGEWLRTPNPAFEGQAPIQVIERGEIDRIWRMIFQIDAGVAN